MSNYNTYVFAEEDPEKLVENISHRFRRVSSYMINHGIMSRWVKSFNSYYGFYYPDSKSIYGMGTAGVQGELTSVVINQYRNLIQHTLALFTQNKLSFDTIPLNSDVSGRNAAIVGNSLLEYTFEQSKYSTELYKMAETGLNLGTSFLFTTWDMNKNFAGVDEDMKPVFGGELLLKSFTPMDVLLEPFKERFEEQEWICTREITNKFDLAARHPEMADDIYRLPRIADAQLVDPYFITDETHVWVYKFYHKASLALPFGRYTEFCSEKVILRDNQPNPYAHIDPKTGFPILGTGLPAVCFRPAIIYGSAWGHTVGFDLLPLQDMKNMLASTIASNQAVFGVQNLIVARGTNMDFSAMGEGLRVLEYDMNPDLGPSGGAPAVLELLKTPQELFSYNNKVDEEMEKLSGINGALRGTPPPQVSSGTAMALLTTQAQTFNTPVENVYIDCCQQVANNVLKIIATFMPETDLIELIGLKEDYAIPAFKAEELSKIQRVKVLTGNAMSKSPAGRLAMAQDMIQSGLISPAEYTEVAATGSIKNKTEDITALDALIQYENQQMMQGIEVPVTIVDNPLKHILGHTNLFNHPDIRKDPAKQQIIMKHMLEHQQNWVVLGKENPQLLALITGSPIPPDAPADQQAAQQQPAQPPQGPSSAKKPEGPPQPPNTSMGKNNLQNASAPGGNVDLAASAMRSASKLLNQGRK